MKVKNKKTGEIVDLLEILRLNDVSNEFYLRLSDNEGRTFKVGCNSLAELNEVWEDAPEEPKEYWYIDYDGGILYGVTDDSTTEKMMKSMGNYFETEEEAEKAVEKLKAWERLKEARFEFGGWTHTPITKTLTGYNLHIKAYSEKLVDYMDDLELIFGGGE